MTILPLYQVQTSFLKSIRFALFFLEEKISRNIVNFGVEYLDNGKNHTHIYSLDDFVLGRKSEMARRCFGKNQVSVEQ